MSRTTQKSGVNKCGKITRKFGTYTNSVSDFCDVAKGTDIFRRASKIAKSEY